MSHASRRKAGAIGRITGLRQWAAEWESAIRRRLAAGETGPTEIPDRNGDIYLDEH
jgi:hypothetical protein